jgi:multisubunit Na+/H+ antiporter MnhB subunit
MISDPECGGQDLNNVIQAIINTVIFVVGIVAVVMVILGGIKYSTSQGDSGKVKSAKDTIMYGIIGLVVAILAFAIVNFVLSSVF